jgi:hypothetical protein
MSAETDWVRNDIPGETSSMETFENGAYETAWKKHVPSDGVRIFRHAYSARLPSAFISM